MTLGFQKFQVKVPAWSLAVLGYTISAASLIWLLHDVDGAQIWQDLQALHWQWVTLAVIADIGVYMYQGVRWNLLLRPVVRVPLWRSIQAIYVGLFTNEILPLRPGEVIRSYLQARWSAIPFSVAVSSVLIERIFDGIWLMAVFSLTALFVTLPGVMMELAKVVAVAVFLMAGVLGLVMFSKHRAQKFCSGRNWARLRVLVEDLHLMGNSRTFYLAALASLPYLLIQVVPIYALIRAYELNLSLWPALVVLVIFRLSTAIPQAPGNVGASQAALVLGLGLFGIDKTTATGYAMMTWGVITMPLLIAGFIALAFTGLRLREIRRHAQTHMEGTPAAPACATESQSR